MNYTWRWRRDSDVTQAGSCAAVSAFTFVDVIRVDAVLSLGQRTVLLRLAVEQEAVVITGAFEAVEHGHVAFCTLETRSCDVMNVQMC